MTPEVSHQVSSVPNSRRRFLKLAAGSALLLPTSLKGKLTQRTPVLNNQSESQPQNILLICTDQQHRDAIGSLSAPYLKTPAMDYLTESSTRFSESYCANPVCVPSRASLFSGRTSSEALDNRRIDRNIPNIGQWFSEHSDYETVYSGKWHLPQTYTPNIPGFRSLTTGRLGLGYITDEVTSRSCEAYIRNTPQSKKFFMVASFMQPHDICEWLRLNTERIEKLPYPIPEEELPPLPPNFQFAEEEPSWVQRLRSNRDPFLGDRNGDPKGRWDELHWRYYLWSYYRHIEQVDAEIERLLVALADTGRLENTLIVFTSDHGEGMGSHQLVRKGDTYDASARVPLHFSWPSHVEQSTVLADPVIGMDIFPTLCAYAGIETPDKLRGKNLRPLLEKKESLNRDCVVVENSGFNGRTVRSKDFKYITYRNDPVEQLFDYRTDPHEMHNRAKDPLYQGILEEHRAMLKKWEAPLEVQSQNDSDAWWRTG